MVELYFVNDSAGIPRSKPIGVFAALFEGFDRVSARPTLIMLPVLLDLLLWLGPRLSLRSLLEEAISTLLAPAGSRQGLGEGVDSIQSLMLEIGGRFNLLSTLSSLPVRIPSLMSGRMPAEAPQGVPPALELSNPFIIFGIWIVITLLGIGLGTIYHSRIARQVARGEAVELGWPILGQVVVLGVLLYVGLLGFSIAGMVVIAMASLISQQVGAVVVLVGFGMIIWVFVYLFFTPHGIIRNKLGVWQAMLESALLVRSNLPGVTGMLALLVVITWLTNQVWYLPNDNSWFSLLASVGHAFVGSVLLAGSYAFYQGRRQRMRERQQLLDASRGTTPPVA